MYNDKNDKELHKIYNEIIKGNNLSPFYQYVSFFLRGEERNYYFFVINYNEALKLRDEGLPFNRINQCFFNLIENYSRGIDRTIHESFYTLFLEKNYDLFANFLSNIRKDFFIISSNKVLLESDLAFYSLVKTMEDIHEVLVDYSKQDNRHLIMEITYCLLSYYWINNNYNFDEVYRIIMSLLGIGKSISEFCLLKGIDTKIISTSKALLIIDSIHNYQTPKRLIK